MLWIRALDPMQGDPSKSGGQYGQHKWPGGQSVSIHVTKIGSVANFIDY